MNRYIVEYELTVNIDNTDGLDNIMFCEIDADDKWEALRIAKKMNPKLKIYQIFLNKCFHNKWNCMRCRCE